MKQLIRLFVSLMVPALMLAFATATPAMKHEMAKDAKAAPAAKAVKGKPVTKVLLDNEKVRATETTYKPGDESDSVARPYRVIRLLKGGTLLRTYADGKTEKYERKTGEVRIAGPDAPYKVKNMGKTDVVFYTVIVKEAKK